MSSLQLITRLLCVFLVFRYLTWAGSLLEGADPDELLQEAFAHGSLQRSMPQTPYKMHQYEVRMLLRYCCWRHKTVCVHLILHVFLYMQDLIGHEELLDTRDSDSDECHKALSVEQLMKTLSLFDGDSGEFIPMLTPSEAWVRQIDEWIGS